MKAVKSHRDNKTYKPQSVFDKTSMVFDLKLKSWADAFNTHRKLEARAIEKIYGPFGSPEA